MATTTVVPCKPVAPPRSIGAAAESSVTLSWGKVQPPEFEFLGILAFAQK